MKLQDASLQVYEKKLFYTYSFMYFASFSQNASRLIPPKRLVNCASALLVLVVLLIIYLFNYDPSQSTSFMQNMASDADLSTAVVK